MGKGLYISVSGEGHVNPTLALVQELVQRGEHIIYYSSDGFREKIEGTGAAYQRKFVSVATWTTFAYSRTRR